MIRKMIRKFRVWDKQIKKMAKVLNIDFENEIVQSVYLDSDHQCLIQANFDDVELMQSTGLFDKNGVEIFEGDIVIDKIGDPLPMVVKWDDAGFRTFGKYNGENYVGYVGHTDRYENNTCTVIGNIYENKELLKDDENFE